MLHAGVRDEDVKPAEALDRRLHGRGVRGRIRQIGRERDSGSVGIRGQVDRQDPHAVALQALGDRTPDAARRPRHEGGTAAGV